MTDEYALNNLSNNVLTINNNDNSEKTYKLVLKVSKDTTIELNNIKFKVEDSIIELDNTSYEDNDNYYYEFNPSSLHKNEKININYILWLDENIKELTGNDLIYSFEVKTI